jgi:hypothetical protein
MTQKRNFISNQSKLITHNQSKNYIDFQAILYTEI